MKAVAALFVAAGAFASVLADPGANHRPETWFHLIGGNVSKAGLTADFEAIKLKGCPAKPQSF